MTRVIVLSGGVASGKSTLARALAGRTDAVVVSTRNMLQGLRHAGEGRTELQAYGNALDRETLGGWVCDGVEEALRGSCRPVVVDAARNSLQIDRLRERWPGAVVHVHLVAFRADLERRHAMRDRSREPVSYADVKADATEAAVDDLAAVADLVVDASSEDPERASGEVLNFTGRFASRAEPLVDVVVGAQYGSEGKGNVCAALAGDYALLMRVGGPNAGHVVHEPTFTFRQLPSGTIANPAAKLLVGPGATLAVDLLLDEIAGLARLGHAVDGARLSIDPRIMVIEPEDREREGLTLGAIASTKQGVGAAAARKILGRGGPDGTDVPVRLARDVEALAPFRRRVDRLLEEAFARGERILLEGTQGTGLSIHHGEWPHVTSRDTTVAGCLAEAGISPRRVGRVVLVVRSRPIRVGGASGPFEAGVSDWETVARESGLPLAALLAAEKGSVSRTQRRVGHFSMEQVRRAAVLNGATDIALTFADQIDAANQRATSFDGLTDATRRFVAGLEDGTGVPVTWVVKGNRVSDVLRMGGRP